MAGMGSYKRTDAMNDGLFYLKTRENLTCRIGGQTVGQVANAASYLTNTLFTDTHNCKVPKFKGHYAPWFSILKLSILLQLGEIGKAFKGLRIPQRILIQHGFAFHDLLDSQFNFFHVERVGNVGYRENLGRHMAG